MNIETFYDPATYTLTYVVFDENTRDAVVIDPVLDYDPLSSQTSTGSVAKVEEFLKSKGLKLHYVLETHAHADHLSGSQYLKRRFGARVAIGERIRDVQQTFKGVFDLRDFVPDGSQFDRLFADGERVAAGSLTIHVIATPGHTPACVTYKIADAVFTGDALFIEDYGTGRCDFPMGSADALYTSVHERLYELPDETRVFVGHDYQPSGRPLRFETTIGRSKEENVQLRASTSREAFVKMRSERDATLTAPRLLYPSVQVNIDAGRLPRPHANGRRYLTIPLDSKRTTEDDGTHEEATPPVDVLHHSASSNDSGYRDVEPGQVASAIGKVRIVDVREPEELRGELGQIHGVLAVPLATIESAARSWDRQEEVVLVCRSGRRSARAAAALYAIGFRRVMNMTGGMMAWTEAHLPIERKATEMPS